MLSDEEKGRVRVGPGKDQDSATDVVQIDVCADCDDGTLVKDDDTRDTEVAPIVNLYTTMYSFNMFTVTDGAIRVVVLLHANNLGFTPIQIALMFTLYELAGVVTNLFGGACATRFGLKTTLFISLILQLIGLVLLMLINPIFGATQDYAPEEKRTGMTVYITLCQMLAGISKDFMKISCKSVPKLVTKPEDNDRLFKLVAWVTGMKNSLKGFGTLLGAILVEFSTFEVALGVLIGFIVLILPVPLFWMDCGLGRGSKKFKVFSMDLLRKSHNVNVLSLARIFLFGSRDVWFEIAAPIFLTSILAWPKYAIGIFMGGYIILYGNFQTGSTRLFKHSKPEPETKTSRFSCRRGPPTQRDVPRWAFMNCFQLVVWATVLLPLYNEYTAAPEGSDTFSTYQWAIGGVLIGGLVIFAFFFAVNSAVHSYLIVLYSGKDKAAMDLGFYYMANAAGRLIGTILSGVIYQFTEEEFGLSICLWVGAVFMFLAGIAALPLKPHASQT